MTAIDVCRQLLADVLESKALSRNATKTPCEEYRKASAGAKALHHLRSKAARAAVCDYLELLARRGLDEEGRK